MTALSGQELEKRGFPSFNDIAIGNPNVKVAQTAGNGVAFNVSIRGNIQNAATLPVDPSVGVYVDGFLVAHSSGTLGLTTDLASVQTLKGPQGTLFGRNITGGAILLQTVDPVLGSVAGYVQAEGGDIGTRRFGGALNVPLGARAALRVVYQNNARDDYQTLADGRSFGRQNAYLLRGKLLVKPTDRLSMVATAEVTRERLFSTIVMPTQPNDPQYHDVPAISYTAPGPRAPGQAPSDPRADGELQQVNSQFYAVTATQQVGEGNLKLLVAHRAYGLILRQTLPPGLGFTRQDKPDNKDVSAKFQYNGSMLDDWLDIASGLFYFHERVNEAQDTFIYAGTQRTTRRLRAETDSKSAYLQATYALATGLRVTGGLCYTDDRKSGLLRSSTPGADGGTGGGNLAAALAKPQASRALSARRLNYLASIDYKPVDGIMIYANTASGYRSGGLGNDRLSPATTSAGYRSITSFLPESVENYEVGVKSQFWQRRITVNAAAFHQSYKDYQYPAVDPNTLQRVTLNADATIKGFELETALALDGGTRLSGNVGLVDGQVTSGPSSGSSLLQVPRWTWDVTPGQDLAVGNGTLSLVATYNWRDRYFAYLNDPLSPGNEERDSNIDPLGLLNVSATYRTGPWKAAVFANNLTNEKYYSVVLYAGGGAINYGALGLPRVVGARLRYSF